MLSQHRQLTFAHLSGKLADQRGALRLKGTLTLPRPIDLARQAAQPGYASIHGPEFKRLHKKRQAASYLP